MRKKIIAITAATLLLATACSCGSQQEPDSTTAKTPDVSTQQSKPQQQEDEKTAQSFVDEFNANSSTQITDVEKFTPSDSTGPIIGRSIAPALSPPQTLSTGDWANRQWTCWSTGQCSDTGRTI